MSDAVLDDVPLSLYLKLEPGQHADLEVVAKASISLVAIIREIARDIDPNIDVDVKIISGTEGSLGLNTLSKIRAAKKKADETADLIVDGLKRKRIHWLALFVAFRILNSGVDWSTSAIFDWLSGKDAPAATRSLSKEELHEIASDIATQIKHDIARKPTQTLFRELDRDHKIEAVGITYSPGKVPVTLIPRSDFSKYADTVAVVEGEERVVTSRIGTTLVSPVLMTGNRRWKFRGPAGEFGAPMKDEAFLNSALNGSLGIPMQAGVVMDVDLETRETFINGVWQIESFAITKVHGWRAAPLQPDLVPSP